MKDEQNDSNTFFLLINCVGSYLYSIMEHLKSEGEINGILLYLRQGILKYRELQMANVKKKYHDNPWGYQPIKIENQEGKSLEIDDFCFQFLFKYYSLEIEKYDIEKYSLMDIFKSVDNDTSFLICTVDELYLSKSKFYEKKHNKHFLLIKSIDYKNNTTEIVDSEVNSLYSITFKELENAIRNSSYKRKRIYRVNGEKYNRDYSLQMQATYKITINSDFIIDMINDIKRKREFDEYNFTYYYKGYYYNIISKIIPYYHMCLKTGDKSNVCYEKLNYIVSGWKSLSKIMHLRIYRNNIDADALIVQLEKIYEKYCNYNVYMADKRSIH